MKINLDRKMIRNFGLLLALVLAILGSLKLYKGQTTYSFIYLTLCFISAASALFFQPLIKPIYIIAMKFSSIMGWINTRVILTLIFYTILTPLSFMMKMLGKKFLDERIEPNKESYWVKRERVPFDKSLYEKQF